MTKDQQPKTSLARFWIKILLYALIASSLPVILTSAWMYVGESMPLQLVAWMQASDSPVLYRPGWGNRDPQFKVTSINTQRPEVMALGSSRILQFRGHFLDQNPDAFYNAAAPAWQIPQIQWVLNNSTHKPNIIILSIDPPWFNEAYAGDPIFEAPVSDLARLGEVNQTYVRELISEEDDRLEFDYGQLLGRTEPGGSGGIALGMRAINDGHGFRNDGSEQYGDFLVAQYLWQPNMRGHHIGLFERGEEMYVAGDTISEERMQEFTQLLDTAQQHDILVIGFLPPYMPSLFEMLAESERHTYMHGLAPRLEELFAEYDYPFFDYSNGAWVGATDEDFFDGWHHSERIALQMYIEMARQVPELQPYSNLEALQEIVYSAPDTFRVFPFMAQQ